MHELLFSMAPATSMVGKDDRSPTAAKLTSGKTAMRTVEVRIAEARIGMLLASSEPVPEAE